MRFHPLAGALFALGASASAASALPAPTLVLTDMATIQFTGPGRDPGTLTFLDRGIMRVTDLDLGPQARAATLGGGSFVRYTATGIQSLSPLGQPTGAVFTTLNYTLERYEGLATFGRDADGTVFAAGTAFDVMGGGQLIRGALGFQMDGSILGKMDVTSNLGAGPMSFTIEHAPQDLAFISPTTFTLDGGKITAAALDVPEPTGWGVLLSGLAAMFGWTTLRRRGALYARHASP